MSTAVAILDTGLITSVGLSAEASCAAIRAKLTNPTRTRFLDSEGEWIYAHQVPLDPPVRGVARLAKMAAMAITECLKRVPRAEWPQLPILLCVAERERPGRLQGLDDLLAPEIAAELGTEFPASSLILSYGRISAGVALSHARRILEERQARFAIIAAADSLLVWPTLKAYESDRRLLTKGNSNGFMPGEGAGALLVSPVTTSTPFICTGVGFAREQAHIVSEEPLRGDGLTRAIEAALSEAHCSMHDVDFRITDLSGEQYYFKESALALARTMRVVKEDFDIWHPAESIGETGALAGVAAIVVAKAAFERSYAPGPTILCHAANDDGQRAAAIVQFRAG